MKVLFLSEHDPLDINSWSGVLNCLLKSLKNQGLSVVCAARRSSSLFSRLLRRLPDTTHFSAAQDVLRRGTRLLKSQQFDLIFAPVASQLIAKLDCRIPVIHFSDGTHKAIYGRPPFSLYYRHTERKKPFKDSQAYADRLQIGEKIEKLALQRATRVVLPSGWAVDSAVRDYGIAREKISMIPIGANVELTHVDRQRASRKIESPLKLLFLGRDWERKGGPIAMETVRALHRRGLEAQLTIVGATRPQIARNEIFARIVPFLDKNRPADRLAVERLMLDHHFLIAPSRAEAYGCAAAEAMAYGLPPLVADVGGMSTVVTDGMSGLVLPLDNRGEHYAARIEELASQETHYQRLSTGAVRDYRERLDWSHFGQQILTVFQRAKLEYHS